MTRESPKKKKKVSCTPDHGGFSVEETLILRIPSPIEKTK